jgi:hypothetical protein
VVIASLGQSPQAWRFRPPLVTRKGRRMSIRTRAFGVSTQHSLAISNGYLVAISHTK